MIAYLKELDGTQWQYGITALQRDLHDLDGSHGAVLFVFLDTSNGITIVLRAYFSYYIIPLWFILILTNVK